MNANFLMKNRRFLIGVAIFFTISLTIYAFLGGLKEVVLTKTEKSDYHLVGRDYEGPVTSDTLRNTFLTAKSLIEEGKVEGTLAILYYKDATNDNDTIKCFTGIIVPQKQEALPVDMVYRYVSSGGAIKARFEGHRLVTPSPLDIKQKVEDFAKNENLSLQPVFIEKYFSNNAIEIDFLIAK